MAQVIEIPLKPYLKKYAMRVMAGTEPVRLHNKDMFGAAIMGLLTKTHTNEYVGRKLGSEVLRVTVVDKATPESSPKSSTIEMTPERAKTIESWLLQTKGDTDQSINTEVLRVSVVDKYQHGADPRVNILEVTPGRAKLIESWIAQLMDHGLFIYLQGCRQANKELKTATLHFMNHYGITEEDVPLATIWKRYQRYKEKREMLARNSA